MSYSGASLILGQGTVSAEAINAWYASRGPKAAESYAPDRTYKPAPADLGKLIIEESRRWPSHVVNHDLIAADIAHESAFWQSAIVRDKHNPSGLGAVNDNTYKGAVTFLSPREGIRATVAHMLSYAVGDGPWASTDPRFAAVKAKGWLGTAPTLRGLNGKWADPGTTYGQSIATLANELIDFANNGTWEPPMAGDDSRFRWMPDVTEFGYPQGSRGRNGKSIDLGIIHYTQGTNSSGWLRGNNGSSTHYLTDRAMRPFEQHVREADAAWTAGNRDYNERGINVEGELPGDQWTPDLIRELAKTTLPIWKRHNIPLVYLGRDNGPGKRGLIGHVDVPNQDHTDPGKTFDWPLYIAELRRLDGQQPPARDWPNLPPGSTVPDPRKDNPFGTFWMPKPFAVYMAGLPLEVTGYVLEPARGWVNKDGETLIIQHTERQRYELHQDGSMTLGLLGTEAVERWRKADEVLA